MSYQSQGENEMAFILGGINKLGPKTKISVL